MGLENERINVVANIVTDVFLSFGSAYLGELSLLATIAIWIIYSKKLNFEPHP